MSRKHINLVVAMCNNRGIGVNGDLPWRLKGDLAFFKKITSETSDSALKNAVIMGRKTWESLPKKSRPLPNRTNIVISSTLTLKDVPQGVHVANGFDAALDLVNSSLCKEVEQTYIIGGSSVYQMALKASDCHRIYLTRVLADVECDTFMPEFDEDSFKMVQDSAVDGSLHTENNLSYKIEVYEKIPTYALGWRSFNCVAAMMSNRGIGKDGTLPWPSLKTDFEFYNRLASTPEKEGKKVVNMKGRFTWEDTTIEEISHPNKIHMIISESMKELPEHAHHLAASFEEGLRICNTEPVVNETDRIWVLGGQQVYTTAVQHPLCYRVYLTRIQIGLDADRFFPVIEDIYKHVKDSEVDDSVIEENGVKYTFEVWQRKTFHFQ